MENQGLLCKLNGNLILSEGKLCIAQYGDILMEIIGSVHGNYDYKWHFLRRELENGTYRVVYESGAISFGPDQYWPWHGGNCYYMNGIVQDGSGIGGSPLPGVSGEFPTKAAAEAAAKGSESTIVISNGGISMYYNDGNVTDNRGSIKYRLIKIS